MRAPSIRAFSALSLLAIPFALACGPVDMDLRAPPVEQQTPPGSSVAPPTPLGEVPPALPDSPTNACERSGGRCLVLDRRTPDGCPNGTIFLDPKIPIASDPPSAAADDGPSCPDPQKALICCSG